MLNHYATIFSYTSSAWNFKQNCDNFSINIMLERKIVLDNVESLGGYVQYNAQANINILSKQNTLLEQKISLNSEAAQTFYAYTDINLYEDKQIDIVYNVLKALTKRGIQKENILGYADVALYFPCFRLEPYSSFWRQFYERHEGFFFVPDMSIPHKMDNYVDLIENLLKIGYAHPPFGCDCESNVHYQRWMSYAINAFTLRYFSDRKCLFEEDCEEKLYKDLKNNHSKILNAIEQVGKTHPSSPNKPLYSTLNFIFLAISL